MPDSLHIYAPAPTPAPAPEANLNRETIRGGIPLPGKTPDLPAADEEMMRQTLRSRHAASTQAAKHKTASPAPALALPDTLAQPGDTATAAASDTTVARTLISMPKPQEEVAAASPAALNTGGADTASWILLGIIALFMLIAARMRNNVKYLKSMLRQSVEWRERQNMFADTMRERSFTFLLGLLSIGCCGLLLSQGVSLWHHGTPPAQGEFPASLWVCMGLAGGYYVVQLIAYLIIGNCFTTRQRAKEWVQGFKAGNALLGLALFPPSLLGVFYPALLPWVLILSLALYFIVRFLFILKGYRIFSGRHAYYLLFLYYLCSVEIAPALMIWHAACRWS